MGECVVFLFFTLELLREKLELALQLAFEEEIYEDVVVFFI